MPLHRLRVRVHSRVGKLLSRLFGEGLPAPSLVPSLSFLPTSTAYSAPCAPSEIASGMSPSLHRFVAPCSRSWGSHRFRAVVLARADPFPASPGCLRRPAGPRASPSARHFPPTACCSGRRRVWALGERSPFPDVPTLRSLPLPASRTASPRPVPFSSLCEGLPPFDLKVLIRQEVRCETCMLPRWPARCSPGLSTFALVDGILQP